ncbi:hypothetical protein M2132_000564 [Dysgonomonas sp. PH5-45]|uniref:BatD family protein n=1 Tax=unclassified Dysgonomonas TaxID=2630389 RepID=UPI00247599F9|nr:MULTISPECIES: BatD family protein [unclassified Dysgonomonas]MDH6354237.1 hypothetical protein [Dysgonomonas sp. PH5-45]MDH6387138.1 hypothetical protein [Dysgonomonas sp. PH5-37]
MKKIILYICLISFSLALKAQSEKIDFAIEVASQEFVVGDKISVNYILTGARGKNFKLKTKEIKNAEILFGPSIYTSSQSAPNKKTGKIETSITEKYTYIILPSAKGTIELPEATIEAQGKQYTAKSIKIKVSGKQDKKEAKQEKQTKKKKKEEYFVRVIASKKTASIGEPVEILYRLYATSTEGQIVDINYPSFRGFRVEDNSRQLSNDFSEEKYKGKNYKTFDLKSFTLYPTDAGTWTISPLKITIATESDDDSEAEYDWWGRKRKHYEQNNIESDELTISVGISM